MSTKPVSDNGTAIPITVLTGFLGAGKTTLLNRLLNGDHGLKVAALVNDFGEINIDAELAVGVENDVISLANGCICCTIRDDLVEALVTTINRPEQPDYLLLEASGVAEPMSIAQTFNNPGLRDRIRTDAVFCVVDAEQVFAAPDLMELKLFQMACADMIILNKVDLVDRQQIAEIRTWLDERFNRYRLIEASHCDVPLEVLLSVGHFGLVETDLAGPRRAHDRHTDRDCDHDYPYDHRTKFETWSYETDRPISLEALHNVAAALPADIYRTKGVIHTFDVPSRRAVLQVVARRVDISSADGWGVRTPKTKIVAVGASGAFDAETMRATFEQCVAVGAP